MAHLAIQSLANEFNLPLKSLYIIHGEEDLLRLEALDALRVAAKKQAYLNRETFITDAHFDWPAFLMSLDSPGLFSELKLLELHIPNGKPGKVGADALLQVAKKLSTDTVIVLFLPKLERVQIQSKWFTTLAQVADVVEAKLVTLTQLPQWIRTRLSRYQLDIDEEALALFVEKVEGNLLAAKQEIDKLALLHPSGSKITLDEAQQAVANVSRYDVFQLSSSWMTGDLKKLIRQLDGLQTAGEEPVLLLWALSEDVRILIRLKAALSQGKTVQQVKNSLRLWGNKQIHAQQAIQRISSKQMMLALQVCAQIDRQIKGAETGSAWDTFRNLILSLAR